MQKQLPIIFGIAGPSLSADETQFFKANPVRGIILFARNIVDRPQLLALTASIRALLGPDVWIALGSGQGLDSSGIHVRMQGIFGAGIGQGQDQRSIAT